ncbi:MAG TPA: hypothetical protein VKU41_00630, partial [Polyangiaceae bacterium]|nr:hypothetical protein [Polyangiaceae bacterium]
FTIDANATFAWSHYQVGVSATNLLDTRYRLGEYNYAANFQQGVPPSYVPSRLFTAGPPRAVFADFTVNFGGA